MMQRKLVGAGAVAAAAILALSACGRDAAPANDDDATDATSEATELSDGPATGTVTIWAQGTEGEALADFLEPFAQDNPDLDIEVTAVPWDNAQNKYQTAVAGGTTPDIGMFGSDWMPTFYESLESVPASFDTSGMHPLAVKSTTFDGAERAVPWYVETRVFYYRTDLLAQAGWDEFPTTWDDFYAMAQDLVEVDGVDYAVALPAAGWNAYLSSLPFPWSNGATVMNDDETEWTLDTPEMVESFEYLESFFEEGLANGSPATDTSNAANLVNGSVPIFLSGPWEIGSLRTAGGEGFDEQFAVAKIPASSNGTSTSFAAGANLGVFTDAQNKDAAWKVIEYLSQPDVQVAWYETVADLPAVLESWEAPVLAEDRLASVFGEQLESARIAPVVPTWPEVSAAGDTLVEQIARGVISPADAMAELQATADGLGTGN